MSGQGKNGRYKSLRVESMESLIKTRNSGDILPGTDFDEDDFGHSNTSDHFVWQEDGLDYDRYLRGFKKGATGAYKSLMSLSKDLGAICGVLMAGHRKGLACDYAVGIDDDGAACLAVDRSEQIWDDWFSQRRIVVIPQLAQSAYGVKTRHSEFRFIRSAILLPVVYHGAPSYVFLGFKRLPSDPLTVVASKSSLG